MTWVIRLGYPIEGKPKKIKKKILNYPKLKKKVIKRIRSKFGIKN
jgi:hypothetical protein